MSRYKKRQLKLRLVIIMFVVLCIILFLWYFFEINTINNVYVEGNVHYTDEEIKDMVLTGPFSNNSYVLALKYRDKEITDIPFVDVLNVEVISSDSVKISVYEKALAGYVRFMDGYMYFDKDGYFVECSTVKTEGVPLILGLDFDHCIIGRKLPVKDDRIFNIIIDLAKLMNKYNLKVDKIYFNPDLNVSLYFGDIEVKLGTDYSNVEDKIMLLPDSLIMLEGKKGILDLSDYTEKNTDFTFKPET